MLARDPREVELHPLLVDHRRPSASVVSRAQRRTFSRCALDGARRAQRDALVVELGRDQLPALVLADRRALATGTRTSS